MHPRLVELSEHLAHQRRNLLDAASMVPEGRWQTRPSGDGWSVSEILEHLHRVERGTAAMLAKRIAEARAAGHPEETETDSVLRTLDEFRVSQLDRKLEAPDRVKPTDNPDRATIERLLSESRSALEAAIASGDGLALGSIRQMHRFGELDLYQGLLFVAEHEKRHTAQVRDVARQLARES
jgi:uncharacterized damage-inducible protein DinB